MPEIGLFPLELVLLPSERVPLHIFEDRYKELIGECLAEGSEFGLILETDGGLREIGTSTAVLEVIHTFDDGRMNVLVEGHDRFRVARLTEGRSFRTAEFETVEDDDEEPTEGEVAAVTAKRDAYNGRASSMNDRAERDRADLEHFNREIARYNLMLVYPDGLDEAALKAPKHVAR